jgi:hypothetical protein
MNLTELVPCRQCGARRELVENFAVNVNLHSIPARQFWIWLLKESPRNGGTGDGIEPTKKGTQELDSPLHPNVYTVWMIPGNSLITVKRDITCVGVGQREATS